MDIKLWTGKAGSALSRLQGTVHKTVKGWYRLKDFIRLLRKCKTRADERSLMAKEAAAIRTALKTSDCPADQRWHSLAKLLFLHLQGFPVVHYGQVECMKLAAACNATGSAAMGMTKGRSQLGAKRLGYLGATLLLDDRQQTLFLLTNTLKQDLGVDEDEHVLKSALNCLAALPSSELFMELASEVLAVVNEARGPEKRKRAAVCLAVMCKRVPEIAEMLPDGLIERLLAEKDRASMLAACVMIEATREGMGEQTVERLAGFIVRVLGSALPNSEEHRIGSVDDPSLVVAQLRTLRLLHSGAPEVVHGLQSLISTRYANSPVDGAAFAVLSEAISCLASLSPSSIPHCVTHLGVLLAGDSNLKMVGLELLLRLCLKNAQADRRQCLAALAKHRGLILQCLKRSHLEDPSIVQLAVELAMGLVVDRATLRVVLPELLRVRERRLVALGRNLVELLNKHSAPPDYLDDALSVLDKLESEGGEEDLESREPLVYLVIEQLSKTSRHEHRQGAPTSVASWEVLVWLEGRHAADSDRLLGMLERLPLGDETLCGYVITACSRMSGRGLPVDRILDGLLQHRKTTVAAKQRAAQMQWLCERAPPDCLLAVPDPLESFTAMDIHETFEDAIDGDGDGDTNANGDGKTKSVPLDWGKRVFEGKGLVVFMARDGQDPAVRITMINPIQHVAQPTDSVSLQVALPKGLVAELEAPTGHTLPPFSTKPISQVLRIKDGGADHLPGRLKIRCRVKYKPAAFSETQTDTFDATIE